MDISLRGQHRSEVRSFTIDDLECRDNKRTGAITFEGVASLVDTPYSVRDQHGEYEETIAPGAFKRTLSHGSDVRLLKNHDPMNVFARTKSGTLEMHDDPHLRALAPSLDPDNPAVQTLRSELNRGDIDQMSVGFRAIGQEWSEDYSERTITEMALTEVSIVTFPASPTTTASVRSMDAIFSEVAAGALDPDELMRALRSMNLADPSPATAQGDYDATVRRIRLL